MCARIELVALKGPGRLHETLRVLVGDGASDCVELRTEMSVQVVLG